MTGFLLRLFTGNPLSMLWVLGGVALGAFALGGGAAWTVQGYRLDAAKAEHKLFVAETKAAGDLRNAETRRINARNKTAKEKADAEHKRANRDLADLYDAYGKLRDQRSASGGFLPGAGTEAGSAAETTLNRADADRALSAFDQGVTGLLREGDEARVELDAARRWAQPEP